MKTIEAAYIMPIVFMITAIAISISFRLHDRTVSYAVSYGILIDQAMSLEDESFDFDSGYSKKEIANLLYDFYLVTDKPSVSVCLSGNSLYIANTSAKNSPPVYFSNFERCDILRKESTFILNMLSDNN